MKKAIVTGGAGFIGSHLSDELAGRGYHVVIIDDLSTGRLSNITSLLDGGKAEFVKGSITELSLLRKYFVEADFVFHQAAVSSVPGSIKDPEGSHRVNATGTLNVLVAARDCKVKKVIFASSAAVYGDSPALPKTEDMIPVPQSPYAITKLIGEYYCAVFQKIYGLESVCLRYFNVYGPRQDPGSPYAAVIPLFFRLAMTGKPPVIYGTGEQSRDFAFVRDIAVANIVAAENDITGVFNLGTGTLVTINELARLIIETTGNANLKPVYRDPRQGDILHSVADISKARAFGYSPRYTLAEGLKETFEAFR